MATECLVTFKVSVKTELSQVVGIVGNQPELGNWDESKAPILKTDASIFPMWQTETPLVFQRGTKLEFKFLIRTPNQPIWEQLPQNRKYRARYNQVALTAEWDNYEGREFIIKKFKSSMCLNLENLQNFTKPSFSGEFDPFDQAENDSEDSQDKFDSFTKSKGIDLDSDSDEEEEEPKKVRKLVKPTIQIDQNSDFQSLYSQYQENPRFRQLRSFNQNDILYEVNDDPIIGIANDDCLLITTFYLPIVVHENEDGSFQTSLFQHSFSLHLQGALRTLKCQKKWFGLLIAFDKEKVRIQNPSEMLINYLNKMNYYPIIVTYEQLHYFNHEFCKRLYQPIMNNDVSVSKLAQIDYRDEMEESFKLMNQTFFNEMSKYVEDEGSIAFIADYRLIYLATFLGQKYPRLSISMFYNRLFPHLDNLKLIPFYLELLNSFLQCDIVCFSNYDTANQFLQIMKDTYQIEYYSNRGNLAFHYYGRQIYVKLQNPSIQCDLTDCRGAVSKKDEILIVGVDIYGHQSGVELKLRHLLKFIKESPLIKENPKIRFVQLQLKAVEDDDVAAEKNLLQSLVDEINSQLYPNGEKKFIELIEEQIDSRYRFELFRQADIYIQTRYSGRHDFYLLEYIHLNELPIALISDSSCYNRGCNSVHTFNVFSNKDFTDKFTKILNLLLNKQYQFLQQQKQIAQNDKQNIRNNQTYLWIENMYIDAKKVNCMLSFAKISLRGKDGTLIKVAHNPKFQHIDLKEVQRAGVKRKLIVLELECLINDQFMIDYKPKHLVQASPHYVQIDLPIMLRQIDDEILDLIRDLAQNNSIYILSNGVYNELHKLFANIPVTLFAENGFLYREDNSQQWQQLFAIDCQCMNQIKKIFGTYASKTEGAIIEMKESSIIWSLKNQEEYAHHIIQDLIDNIQGIIERYPNFQVIRKHSSIEVGPSNLNKGMMLELIMHKESLSNGKIEMGIIVARGIDDEDIFSHLKVVKQQHKYTTENSLIYGISMGLVPSYASHYIHNQKELLSLLKGLL